MRCTGQDALDRCVFVLDLGLLPLSLISSIRHVVVEQIWALENGAVRGRLLGTHSLTVGPIMGSVKRERLTRTSSFEMKFTAWPMACTGLSCSIRRVSIPPV